MGPNMYNNYVGIEADALRRRRRMKRQQKRSSQTLSELHILKASSPSVGQPWPLPQSMRTQNSPPVLMDIHHLSFGTPKKSCDIIKQAIERFKLSVSSMSGVSWQEMAPNMNASGSYVGKVEIHIEKVCGGYPTLSSDESCEYMFSSTT